MARARNIKPGFYKNEDLAECSVWARFIFPGLWMLADREGRLEDRPKRIKGELLPFDSQDAEPLLAELEGRGFILRYKVDGKAFIQIIAFSKHQNPHHREPESDIPPPKSPGLSPDGTTQKPEALPPCNEPKAQGKPEASPRLHPPKSDLARGVNRADSLIPDSGFSDSGSNVSEPDTPREKQPPITPPPDDELTARKGKLCRVLRALNFDAAPHLDAWNELLPNNTDAEIIGAAEAVRETRPSERFHLNYLVPKLKDKATPKPQAKREPPWWSSPQRIQAKGKELGLYARAGEEMPAFKDRIEAKIREMEEAE